MLDSNSILCTDPAGTCFVGTQIRTLSLKKFVLTPNVINTVCYVCGQGWRFLVESGGMKNCPKITLGYFWSPNTQFILNWATFGAQAGIFDTERPDLWTCLPLYDSKDGMKSMLKWTTCQHIRSTRRVVRL